MIGGKYERGKSEAVNLTPRAEAVKKAIVVSAEAHWLSEHFSRCPRCAT